MLGFGMLATVAVSWYFQINVPTAGIIAFLVLATLQFVHAPEDSPGGIDNPDGELSHPLLIAGVAVLAAVALLVLAVLFPAFGSLAISGS